MGNKQAFYIGDTSGGTPAGILVQRCTHCTWEAPLAGAVVSFTGYLSKKDTDTWISVGAAGVTPSTQHVAAPSPTAVTPDHLVGADGASFYGVTVDLQDGPFTITSVTPTEEKNPNFDASGTGCTKGPEYFGIEVTSHSGTKILVETGCYRSIDITTTQACSRSSKLLQLNHVFTRLGGVYDIRFGKHVLIPADKQNYVYQ